jgi:hypothetical protein
MLAGFETGWVESHMNNLPCGDKDSLGVFQQRPSWGWGSPEQILNVEYASNRFFAASVVQEGACPACTAGQIAQNTQNSGAPGSVRPERGEGPLAAGGGTSAVHAVDGVAAVEADPMLGLPTVFPAEVLEAPDEATRTYDRWAAAVAARTAAEPDWRPVLESSEEEWPPPNQPAELLRWLADREAAFPDWVARYAPDGTWDFSGDFLDRLGDLLLAELDDKEALDDPAHADFVGAPAGISPRPTAAVGTASGNGRNQRVSRPGPW